MNQNQDAKPVVTAVSVAGMICNTLLTLFKLIAGIVSRSGAMISDAVHSASDVFSGIIVIVGARISSKPPIPTTRTDTSGLNVWLKSYSLLCFLLPAEE